MDDSAAAVVAGPLHKGDVLLRDAGVTKYFPKHFPVDAVECLVDEGRVTPGRAPLKRLHQDDPQSGNVIST